VEIIAVTGDAPTRPLRSAPTEEPRVQNPRRRRDYERHNSHMERRGSIPRAESHPAACRGGDQSPRKEPAIAKAIVDTTTTGCARERHLPSFRHNPCGSPRLGLSVPQRSFKLRTIQLRIHLVSVSQRSLELSTEPRDVSVSGLATKLTRGPVPRLWRQAVSRRKTPALTGVR